MSGLAGKKPSGNIDRETEVYSVWNLETEQAGIPASSLARQTFPVLQTTTILLDNIC